MRNDNEQLQALRLKDIYIQRQNVNQPTVEFIAGHDKSFHSTLSDG